MKRIFSAFFMLAVLAGCGSDDSATANEPVVIFPEPQPDPETPPAVLVPVITQYQGYTLLWNDEFEGTALDPTKWVYETGTGVNGDFGTGQLDRATDRPENVSFLAPTATTEGALAITTRKETYMDRNYTSGRINTNTKFSAGPGTRIEARIWARDVKYKGQGFAFWMMPAEKPADQPYIMWPQGGEIDVMEYVGAIPYANLGSVHYAWFWENNQFQSWNHGHMGAYYNYAEQQKPNTDPQFGGWPVADNTPNTGSGGYHLYRIDWYMDRIEFSIDEHVYHINYMNDGAALGNTPDGEDAKSTVSINGKNVMKSEYTNHFNEWKPFEHKFYFILSAGVGGNDTYSYGGAIVPSAVFPCTTLVDYIRVYNRN
ncbi:glycoside hydrolase family 16 protein [Flavobacterium subsaxonicum]|uniref:glycoside hydrolase family 16 protein n=1 Tax=Flavobacterium subsaxonicum TaxID=426226 RepID=UPI000401E52D|nr:family 16 glycosylhydrolase [Flavobacterium subsaxonicum]